MKRTLVLTTESARHPLRRSLPPMPRPKKSRDDDHDVKLFLLSFVAFFICFCAMIA